MRAADHHSGTSIGLVAMKQVDWYVLAAVLGLALVLRIVFYTGFYGSDEVTYVGTAAKIAAGDWRASNYIGATRYGMNLPVALFIYLFGLSEASANLWPMLCSIGEVATVFIMARWLWGTRVAVLSALVLALLPLHVHFAGRMMADPPLAFFLTISVALLLRAACSKYWLTFLAAGIAWGGVFWVKETVGLLYAPVFVLLGFYCNWFDKRLLWLFAGMGLAVAANCVLMYFVADNPMHVFAVMKGAVVKLAGTTTLSESPWYYLRYLFMDIRHTFLLGFLALAGIMLYAKSFFQEKGNDRSTQFVVLWMLLLVGMFSFAVVSFSPIKLVMKQTNYMLIFVGPMALMAGWFLAVLPRWFFVPVGVLTVSGSLVLAALEQQSIAVFTANSKAAYVFLRDQPNAFLVGTTNNEYAVIFYSLMENRRELRDRTMSFNDMTTLDLANSPDKLATKSADMAVFALLDLQNIDWGNKSSSIKRLSDVPKCWTSMGTLAPAPLGSGSLLVNGLMAIGAVLPASLQQRYITTLQPVAVPKPAHLFKVNHSC